MGRTQNWRALGNLMVVVHGAESPSVVDWARYVNELRAHVPPVERILVRTRGGAPDGKQRAAFTEVFRGEQPRVAVMTGSRMVQGVVNAFRIFNPSTSAFALDGWEDVGEFLGLSAEERVRATTLAAELERELSGPRTSLPPSTRAQPVAQRKR
ncbi:MAG TPA: hypothetical protein VFQ35_24420 [Polyangiaceae bacterium]|nr:hypothetical protein [Polyangiaceae bacterium]